MKDTAIFLFDVSGKMAQPWLEAGYECWTIDEQHPPALATNGVTTDSVSTNGVLHKVNWDLSKPWLPPLARERIAFVFAFPPCDNIAVSGSPWFKGKGLRKLAKAIELFATAAEFCEWAGAPYGIENPVSTISTYWRKPDYIFHPHQFTGWCVDDNYTKKTCLWVGNGFVMPDTCIHTQPLPPPDDRIHKCSPGKDRPNIRSATPLGFARAVFDANATSLTEDFIG